MKYLTILLLLLATCSSSDMNGYPDQDVFIFEENFEDVEVGSVTTDTLLTLFPDSSKITGIPSSRVKIENLNEDHGNVLSITYLKGEYSQTDKGKVQFYYSLGDTYQHLYISYNIFFSDGFDFVKGGKLPGLSGGQNNSGGSKPTGFDGWSGRLMWRENGLLVNYMYHFYQPWFTGEDFEWKKIETGVWYNLTYRIEMNTTWSRDGELQAWIDGEEIFNLSNFQFRNTYDFGIDTLFFSTFYGGSNSSWAPGSDGNIKMDDFYISTARPIWLD